MSPINIDFEDAKPLEPLEEGEYSATVIKAEEGVSQAGNPKIDLRWEVTEGEHEGRLIFDNLTFTQKSLWRVKQLFEAAGMDAEGEAAIDADELVGIECNLLVSIEEGNVNQATGENYPPRNRVNKYKTLASVADLL